MKINYYLSIFFVIFLIPISFTHAEQSIQKAQKLSEEEIKLRKDKIIYKAFIPAKFDLYEAIEGDLNKDGKKDAVLIVKATDPKAFVHDEYRGELDRNRRGIIVLLNQNGRFVPIVRNLTCFSSENEDGGVYYAPELWVEIGKNILSISYSHGRYGHWNYGFRLEGNDLRLIGYDDSNNHGPYVISETSINFLTGKKLIRENMSQDEETEPRFKEKWSKANYPPVYLSKIKNFDDLSF